MIFVVLLQNFRHGTLGSGLLLGWDSPGYVWSAKYLLTKDPINMIRLWSYPHLYVVFLAFLGYLNGDVLIIERILPVFFGLPLVYANGEAVRRITQKVHIAGLASFLTAISINVLRVLSDLNRNFMALALSSVFLLQFSSSNYTRSFFDKRYLCMILVLLVIASTHFETFFILLLSLLLYGVLIRSSKELVRIVFACTIPVVILLLLFPRYFVGYTSTVVIFRSILAMDEIIRWTGGSIVLVGFLIIGAVYTFYTAVAERDRLALLVFCWFFIIVLQVISLQFLLSSEFSRRTLLLMPVPVLLALSASACNDIVKSKFLDGLKLFMKRKCLASVNFRKLLVSLLVLYLMVSSVDTTVRHIDIYFSPFIPRPSYERIIIVKDFLVKNNLSVPIVVFRGDPPIWFVTLHRNYLGSELGEHFAYYGDLENLFHLIPSKPKIDYNAYLSELERFCLLSYYNELVGNYSTLPPMYVHESHILTIEDLLSHPIVIVTPDFYNDNVPCCIKSFYVGDGIYVIPPHSPINFTEVFYGPEITVIRDGVSSNITSEYSHIDPYDPSLIYLKVNASAGYQSYNFTNFPSNLTFVRMEQGGDLSHLEHNPMRLDGTKALVGNDPVESLQYWTIPIAEPETTFGIDPSTKKEGDCSLKITGKTDSWGNLGVRFDGLGTWNLAGYSSIGLWVKCNESATFSVTLVDCYRGSRTFWGIKAGGSSATTCWKRFVVNLTEYTSQSPDFVINSVDYIDLFVYSESKKGLSFWVDDLTVDTTLDLGKFVYKDRVPVEETVVAYFYTFLENG